MLSRRCSPQTRQTDPRSLDDTHGIEQMIQAGKAGDVRKKIDQCRAVMVSGWKRHRDRVIDSILDIERASGQCTQ